MERGLGHCLASGGLHHTCPMSSHFTHSPYVTLALVLNPRMGRFLYVLRLCGPFKWSLLKIQHSFHHQTPTILLPNVVGIYLSGTGPWTMQSDLGLGLLALKVFFLIFIHHT